MQEIFSKIKFIEKLHAAGLLSDSQGTKLLNIALNNGFSNNIQKPADMQNIQKQNNSDFFNSESRKNLKDFFQNNFKIGENFDESAFVNLIQQIEEQAVNGYKKQQDFGENLKRSNTAAKEKLTAQAQNSQQNSEPSTKIFTREEIGKMSLEDYQKNESTIMSQLEQGLIS